MTRWRRTHRNPTVQTTASENGNGFFAVATEKVLPFTFSSTEEAMRKLDTMMAEKYPAHNCDAQRCQEWHQSKPSSK